jgi:hypothetical protein
MMPLSLIVSYVEFFLKARQAAFAASLPAKACPSLAVDPLDAPGEAT